MSATHWGKASIRDISAKVGSGATPKGGKEAYHQTGIPLIRSLNVRFEGFRHEGLAFLDSKQAGELGNVIVQPNDVLLNITGASIGRVTVAPDEMKGARVNQHVCIIRLVDGIEPSFLRWFLASPTQQAFIFAVESGVTRQALTKDMILNFEVPIPPRMEQCRLVSKLDELFSDVDAGVAALKRAQANLKRYRASVLKTAVEGKLTEEWRAAHPDVEPAASLLNRILAERRRIWEAEQLAKFAAAGKTPLKGWKEKYQEPRPPDTSGLPELPKGWCWTTIETLSQAIENAICAGPFGTIFKARDFRPSGVPIIFLRHVAEGRYLTHKPGFMDSEKWETLFKPYSVYGGELLVTKMGEPPGVAAIYPFGIGPAMVTPDVIKTSLDESAVLPAWLMHYLNSRVAKRIMFGAAYGTTRPRVTIPMFRQLVVPVPPREEQLVLIDSIESHLANAEKTDHLIRANVIRATRMRQSILKDAFEGRLVPQDPKDEPASVLLEHIKASLNGAVPSRPGRTAPKRK
jgi:type I restriction enzyme, S subunit